MNLCLSNAVLAHKVSGLRYSEEWATTIKKTKPPVANMVCPHNEVMCDLLILEYI